MPREARKELAESDFFYDGCENVVQFLRSVLAEVDILGVNVNCISSYAVLYRTEELTLLDHMLVHPHAEQQSCMSQVLRFKHLTSDAEIGVGNCVAFSTWAQPFSNGDRTIMFNQIASKLGAVRGEATNCRWVIGGCIPDNEGFVIALASEYKAEGMN